jgi:hypothetical protein
MRSQTSEIETYSVSLIRNISSVTFSQRFVSKSKFSPDLRLILPENICVKILTITRGMEELYDEI